MDIYFDTYEEAAAVEGCDVVLTTDKKWNGAEELIGKFLPTKLLENFGYTAMDGRGIIVAAGAWAVATLEQEPEETKVTYEWWEDLDSLKYPIPLKHTPSGSITSWDRDDIEDNLELDEIPDDDYFKNNWIPATREEVQQLLDNVWEG